MDLGGTWRAELADEDLRRIYPGVDFDDGGWEPVTVPGHWRSVPRFAASDGPLLYRRRFTIEAPPDGRRSWLTFGGIFYAADVWLDGSYVGDAEGYFVPHSFEVTDALAPPSSAEHVLAVEVACNLSPEWEWLDPAWNPGGIWRPVSVRDTGPVAITALRVLCLEATPERAVLGLIANVDAAEAGVATLRTTVGIGTEAIEEHRLAAGENRVAWKVAVEAPPLWWPHALGSPDLVDVRVSVHDADGGESDRRTVRTGIREVRMSDFVMSVNGERLFLKGTNVGPARMAIADATPEEIERDVVLAKEAGLDLLRVHAHVGRPELYDAADRHGMLVWQDVPTPGRPARRVRKQAAGQAVGAIDSIGHHPSIAIWCGNGGSVHRALEKADRSRPVVSDDGLLGRASHPYFGWYRGRERDLPRFAAAWPRAVRFVAEFGAQAVPRTDGFMDAGAWPLLDWERLAQTHSLDRALFVRNGLDPDRFPTYDGWRDATQAYQATVIRHHVETLRRLKYRPCGGFAQFLFADGHPGVTWSVLDDARVAKRGYDALAAACAPVVVVADRPDASYAPGAPIRLDVHVVSDLREPIAGAVVRAELSWEGGARDWSWTGDVPADSCVRVGVVEADAPAADGRLTLDLTVEGPGVKAANRYESSVLSPVPGGVTEPTQN